MSPRRSKKDGGNRLAPQQNLSADREVTLTAAGTLSEDEKAPRIVDFLSVLIVAAAFQGWLLSSAAAGEPGTEAKRFVETFGSKVIDLLKAPGVDGEEREDRLRHLLYASLDLDGIGRYILGKHWHKATPEQRREYQALFARYALSLFSRKLTAERPERIAVVGLDANGGRDANGELQPVVHTRIEGGEEKALRWSWRLQQADGGYRATDLIMNGVSLAKTYRDEMSSMVGRLGIEGLLKVLWLKAG